MKHAVVGIGNWGHWLASRLCQVLHEPPKLVSRNPRASQAFADSLNTTVDSASAVDFQDPNLVVWCCLPDDQLVNWYKTYKPVNCVFASGALPLPAVVNGRGLATVWPIASITKNVEPDWSSLPLVVELATEHTDQNSLFASTVEEVAALISELPIQRVGSSEARLALHLGAVLTQNFGNALWFIAARVAEAYRLDHRMLLPLMHNYLQKLQDANPQELQTGPAVRGDVATQKAHLKLLAPADREIYQMLSALIVRQRSEEKKFQ